MNRRNIQNEPERIMVDERYCSSPPPALMTEPELIQFLRIPEVSKAKDYGYVVENLKRMHGLPCIHLCRKPLYPLKAIEKWIDEQCEKEKLR